MIYDIRLSGVMAGASASLSLDMDSIPLSNSTTKPRTFCTTASLFKLQNKKDRVEKKVASSNAASFGKLLNTSIFMRHTDGELGLGQSIRRDGSVCLQTCKQGLTS